MLSVLKLLTGEQNITAGVLNFTTEVEFPSSSFRYNISLMIFSLSSTIVPVPEVPPCFAYFLELFVFYFGRPNSAI